MKDARPQHYTQNRFRKHVAASSVVDPLCSCWTNGAEQKGPVFFGPRTTARPEGQGDAKSSKLEHMFTFAIHFTNIDLLSSNVKESLKREREGVRVCLVD